jgi:hypothetical protein
MNVETYIFVLLNAAFAMANLDLISHVDLASLDTQMVEILHIPHLFLIYHNPH